MTRRMYPPWLVPVIPLLATVVAAAVLFAWHGSRSQKPAPLRLPGADGRDPSLKAGAAAKPITGTLTRGDGVPSKIAGDWPQFRGPDRAGRVDDAGPLLRQWPASGPAVLWSLDVGEGYAGPAVWQGRVYLLDYDAAAQSDTLRCLSLDDGREIWRYAYPVKVKRNHGMSRTVPAIAEGAVVTLGPKCHVLCVDAVTGEKRWMIDLVNEHGSIVPPWYAGQCPLIDGGRVILAPCGPSLMVAVDIKTGAVVWQTPNPKQWKMTHASIMPMKLAGRQTYVYCGSGGVAGVDAATGAILWETDAWRIDIATVPSPVAIDGNRLFLSGGYDAGSMMLEVQPAGEEFEVRPMFQLDAAIFGATQQTPVLYREHIYGVRADGQLACLNLSGAVQWASGPGAKFGLGPLLIAGDVLLALDDRGQLTMAEAQTSGYQPVASAKVLDGHDAWGPMALVAGRLLVRDLTQLRCLDLRGR